MKKMNVLHVEDDVDAAYFLKRGFDKAKLGAGLKHVPDGEEAIRYLDRIPPYDDPAQNPVPDVILLDLKMPRKDGFEVLSWIKERPKLSSIPVIVLTSSDREDDLRKAKSLGATLYLTKTISFGNVIKTVEEMLSDHPGPQEA